MTLEPPNAKTSRKHSRQRTFLRKPSCLLLKAPPQSSPLQPLPEVSTIEAWAFRKILAGDEETRRQGDLRRHLQKPEERHQWPDLERIRFTGMGMESSHLFVHGEEIDMWLADYQGALARYDISIVQPEAPCLPHSQPLADGPLL